jgi:hypothetical protein
VVSDHLKGRYGVESLRYAAIGSTAFYLAAGALALCAVRSIRRDWVAED